MTAPNPVFPHTVVTRLRSERRPLCEASLEKCFAFFDAVGSVVYGEDSWFAGGSGTPQGASCVSTVLADDVVLHVEIADFLHVTVVVTYYAAQCFHTRIFGRI